MSYLDDKIKGRYTFSLEHSCFIQMWTKNNKIEELVCTQRSGIQSQVNDSFYGKNCPQLLFVQIVWTTEKTSVKNFVILLTELKALAELIGPYGMKYMGEKLMFHVANQVEELKVIIWVFSIVLVLIASYDLMVVDFIINLVLRVTSLKL